MKLAVMTQHRNSVNIPLSMNDHPSLQQCVDSKSSRVFIFCASEISGTQNITFPHQSELKVNGGDIKANLRGLKNKPGSTRPVDITNALRLRPNYVNNVDFTYALTNKVWMATTIGSLPDNSSTNNLLARNSTWWYIFAVSQLCQNWLQQSQHEEGYRKNL